MAAEKNSSRNSSRDGRTPFGRCVDRTRNRCFAAGGRRQCQQDGGRSPRHFRRDRQSSQEEYSLKTRLKRGIIEISCYPKVASSNFTLKNRPISVIFKKRLLFGHFLPQAPGFSVHYIRFPNLLAGIDKRICDVSRTIFVCYPQFNRVA